MKPKNLDFNCPIYKNLGKLMKNNSFLILFILLTFSICGCVKKKAKYQLEKKNIIRTNINYMPLTLDPRISTDPVSTHLHLMLYEGLTHLEPDGTLSFSLAKSVEISKDLKTYTFHLKKSYWSDNTPLTAFDFEASWKEILKPEFPSRTSPLLFPIKNSEKAKKGLCSINQVGIKAQDASTLIVELERATPYFMQLTAYTTLFPVPNQGKKINLPKNNKTHLICNGPFCLSSWKNENEIILKKNVKFWNVDAVKIDQVSMTVIGNENTVLELFKKNALDWIGGLISPLPIDAILSLHQTHHIHIAPIVALNFCVFNTETMPFNNEHIRKAFAYAINRELITEHVTKMFDRPATRLIPSILKKKEASPLFLDGNVKKAQFHLQKGLEELGLKKEDLPPLRYYYFSCEIHQKLAQALQSQWKNTLGLDIQLQCLELKVFLDKLHHHDFQFAQMSWIAQYFDQMSFLERFITKNTFRNYSLWENPTYHDLLLSSFKHTALEERDKILEQAEKLLIEAMPIAPIHFYNALYLQNPQLQNVRISPLGHVDFRYADFRK